MNNFELQNEYRRECASNSTLNIPNLFYSTWLENKVMELRAENPFYEAPISDAELKKYNEEVEESLTNARLYIVLVMALSFIIIVTLIITR